MVDDLVEEWLDQIDLLSHSEDSLSLRCLAVWRYRSPKCASLWLPQKG